MDHSHRQGTFFHPKRIDIFLISPQKICCGYSLEAPCQGASNEYHNICFCGQITKILCGCFFLSGVMIPKIYLKMNRHKYHFIKHTVNFLKFRTLYSILFWLKICFLCSSFFKYLVEWQTV